MKLFSWFFAFFLFAFSHSAYAGFNWGSGCEAGSGTFQQQIQYYAGNFENAVTVGTIPKNLKNVYISLKSTKDVDIRLYDAANGKKIVHWPYGLINTGYKKSVSYNGVTIEYSGYNGDGTGQGNEYIKITGVTKNNFIMKAFGYLSGYAKVDYSWAGKVGCSVTTRKSGYFNATLNRGQRTYLGTIPAGLDNPVVFLNATNDVDIELYDAVTNQFVVGWKSAYLNSPSQVIGTYKGDKIVWSGWNGRFATIYNDTKTGINPAAERGREFIRIKGKSKNSYKMYVYGYQSGVAKVEYSRGVNPVYAGIWGMGINFLGSNSNQNMETFSAVNGVCPSFF